MSIHNTLEVGLGVSMEIEIATQADIAPSCRAVLQKVSACISPDHQPCLFGDITNLLPNDVKTLALAPQREHVTLTRMEIHAALGIKAKKPAPAISSSSSSSSSDSDSDCVSGSRAPTTSPCSPASDHHSVTDGETAEPFNFKTFVDPEIMWVAYSRCVCVGNHNSFIIRYTRAYNLSSTAACLCSRPSSEARIGGSCAGPFPQDRPCTEEGHGRCPEALGPWGLGRHLTLDMYAAFNPHYCCCRRVR